MSFKKRPFKTYRALLTQSGGAAPTAKVLENTLGDIVWSRTGAGNYLGTLAGAFDINKLQVFFGGNSGSFTTYYVTGFNDANSIYLTTSGQNPINAFTPVDDGLFEMPIEIRVYP